jgi:hypothetical protein
MITRTPVATPTREALAEIFRDLERYGIAAHPEVPSHPARARALIRDAILASFPDAIGSYVFWTAADAAAFADDGRLTAPLTLHHSGPDVAGLLHHRLRAEGWQVTDGGDTLLIAA